MTSNRKLDYFYNKTKTHKLMKKPSIVLLLIGISFMMMEANDLSERRTKRLVLESK